MRTFFAISGLSLFMIGCASVGPHGDNFASLHSSVKQTLADSSDCGPIITNEIIGGRYFEVSPQPRGLRVTVSERMFLGQKEWERRYASGTNLMSQFVKLTLTNDLKDTNQLIEVATRFSGITNLFGLSELPEWSYESIGIDVRVKEVDLIYPGSQEDNEEAQKRYNEIVKLLRAYRRPNKSLQRTAASRRSCNRRAAWPPSLTLVR